MNKIVYILFIVIILTGCSKTKDYTIELDGNPTTGYEWTCSDSNNLVSINSKYNNDSSMIGSGGKYVFTITPLKEGNTQIICTYKRNWETSESDEVYTLDIEIDENLNIKKDALN